MEGKAGTFTVIAEFASNFAGGNANAESGSIRVGGAALTEDNAGWATGTGTGDRAGVATIGALKVGAPRVGTLTVTA